jgi:two-component system chemotaxis sensor kinase CheA
MNFDDEAIFRTFLEESEEGLSAIEESIIALEAGTEPAGALQSMFRSAHTLKGNALNLDLPDVAEVAHVLEDVLGQMREGALETSAALATLLLRAVDTLRLLVSQATLGGAAGSKTPEHAAVLEALRRVAAGEALETAPAAAAGTAEPRTIGSAAYDSRGRTLRVNIDTLDRLLNLTGEIAVARARVQLTLERSDPAALRAALEAHHEADRLHADLQELVMNARMVAIGPTFRLYRRAVRDIASSLAKEARLVIEGEDVEVDTRIVEHLRDPLTHMIRNALDHGIESPAVRRARGKDPCGRIRLAARHEAGRIVVEVADDGAGLDSQRIVARAIAQGLTTEEAAHSLDARDIQKLIFAPGFSTAESITELSGRGVGLDVVRRNIEAVRGTIALDSRAGEGTTMTLRLPLTVAIVPGFAVAVGDETYVLPLDAVLECLELPADPSRRSEPAGVLNLRGQPMPYLRLRDRLECGGAPPEREHVVVVQHDGGTAGLTVDALLGERQTVLKPLGRVLGDVPGIAGAAVLGGGRVGLVLDIAGLFQDRLPKGAADLSGHLRRA